MVIISSPTVGTATDTADRSDDIDTVDDAVDSYHDWLKSGVTGTIADVFDGSMSDPADESAWWSERIGIDTENETLFSGTGDASEGSPVEDVEESTNTVVEWLSDAATSDTRIILIILILVVILALAGALSIAILS